MTCWRSYLFSFFSLKIHFSPSTDETGTKPEPADEALSQIILTKAVAKAPGLLGPLKRVRL
jgi:hypothetical protein